MSNQGSAVVLTALWSMQTFGQFANAMAACAWLAFVTNAAEKAALTSSARVRRLIPDIARLTLRFAALPGVGLLAVLGLCLVINPQPMATLYVAAASWSAMAGFLMTVSGLHRLSGRPELDAVAFGAVTIVNVTVTAATWRLGLSPTIYLLLQLAGMTVVTGLSLAALPRIWIVGPLSRRRLTVIFGRNASLLGLSDLMDVAAISAVFLVLMLVNKTEQSGPLFLALMVASLLVATMLYLLKLYQPAAAARLRGARGHDGRVRAYRLLGIAVGGGAACAVLISAYGVLHVSGVVALASSTLALCVLLAIYFGLAMAVMYGTFLLENTDSRILSSTSAAATVGALASAGFAAALVPAVGAAGGLCALVLSSAVKAAVLRVLLGRRHPELRITSTL
ncbi:hypothetical protein E1218_08500 [Kribbella turkmenica]|uniref:Polysaccharide biosynthesis protein n=1 Tax=Kribbella turkmenica TaxID=2530375 RepID=A0A4R4XBN5_9ACTN|nr:hypothetical protein [Kribbella turkmenica]TDD28068.1 hypothetical protein E1218_08500 [Kribbella turkmenica]